MATLAYLEKVDALVNLQGAALKFRALQQLGVEIFEDRGTDQHRSDFKLLCENLVPDLKLLLQAVK